jgi:hypothetical protein
MKEKHLYYAGSALNQQSRNKTEIHCFATILQQPCNTYETLLQPYSLTSAYVRVICNSAESRNKSVTIKRFLFVASFTTCRQFSAQWAQHTNTKLS